ncbi:MAG TPA: hypothetical protein VFP50_07110 [Anaeromyxobacteraceae bacterium]|nr:hypothetical protein [Anaeromyxobacteraceae bacterium]
MTVALALLLLAAAEPAPAAAEAAPALPPASPRAVHTRLSTNQPRLGAPFDYDIAVRHDRAERWSAPADPKLAPFRAAAEGCRRADEGEDVVTTCRYRLSLFELGARDVPPVRLEVATPAGPRAFEVKGPRVEAAGVIDPAAPEGELELRPPAPPAPLLVRSWRLVWWAVGAAASVLAAVLAWRAWRGRARRAAEPPPPVPADVRFARRLDALEAERLAEQGRAREHFIRLSEAVREYLGAVTGVNALDLTTGELLDALAAGGDPRLDLPALRQFAETADLVKFARAPAGGYECQAALGFARALLARTRPPPATAPAAPEVRP